MINLKSTPGTYTAERPDLPERPCANASPVAGTAAELRLATFTLKGRPVPEILVARSARVFTPI